MFYEFVELFWNIDYFPYILPLFLVCIFKCCSTKLKCQLQTALRLQRLKEARDYSFLFKDEDPTTSSLNPTTSNQHPTTSAHRNGVHESASRKQG